MSQHYDSNVRAGSINLAFRVPKREQGSSRTPDAEDACIRIDQKSGRLKFRNRKRRVAYCQLHKH